MKKRTITLVLSLLAVMMLVGVGFATWVITQNDSKDATGNIIVETVTDNRVSMVVEEAVSGQKIVFGAPSSAGSGWLTSNHQYDPDHNPATDNSISVEETMSVQFNITVSTSGSFASANDVVLSADAGVVTSAGSHTSLIGDATISGLDAKTLEANGTITAVLTVTYTWGSLFGNHNPYEYFNQGHTANEAIGDLYTTVNSELGLTGAAALTAASTYADFAKVAIQKVEELFDGATFTVTIAANHA